MSRLYLFLAGNERYVLTSVPKLCLLLRNQILYCFLVTNSDTQEAPFHTLYMALHQQAVLREQDLKAEEYFMTPLSGEETKSEIMSKFYKMTSHPLQVTKTFRHVKTTFY